MFHVNAIVIEGERYNVGEIVVVGFHNDEPLFDFIKSLWHFKSEIYVFCHLIIIRFNLKIVAKHYFKKFWT